MAREIDLDAKSFTEDEKAYLRQRPWMLPADDERLADESDESEEGEETTYEDMNKNELRLELKRRDLDYSDANKDELIARLEEDDAEDAEEADEE